MTSKYDFEFSGLSIGIIVTASSIRGAFRILEAHAKYPHKFTLNMVIDRNGSDVITEQHRVEFKRLVEAYYIQTFEKKKKQSNETITIGGTEVLKDNPIFIARKGCL